MTVASFVFPSDSSWIDLAWYRISSAPAGSYCVVLCNDASVFPAIRLQIEAVRTRVPRRRDDVPQLLRRGVGVARHDHRFVLRTALRVRVRVDDPFSELVGFRDRSRGAEVAIPVPARS